MSVAAIDIGTNSMRLLILGADGTEVGRWVRVTGLGRGVDASGRLSKDRIDETIGVLAWFGRLMHDHDVTVAKAVATSASRDAANGPAFIDAAETALGVRPDVISGTREAELSFIGATVGSGRGRAVVIDIGGGSTEFIVGTTEVEQAISVDIGSVRLTDRCLPEPPVVKEVLDAARAHAASEIGSPVAAGDAAVIGVAGTFTSLAAINLGLDTYDRERVHGATLAAEDVDDIIARLATSTVEEIATIPSLDSRRAPVILGGAIVAAAAMAAVGSDRITASESDLLDALARELVAESAQSD